MEVCTEWQVAADSGGRARHGTTSAADRAAVDGLGTAYTPEALAEPFLHSLNKPTPVTWAALHAQLPFPVRPDSTSSVVRCPCRRHRVRVLEDWSPSFEGTFVFYPGHRQVPASLRAFIDMIRGARGPASPRSSRKNPFAKDRTVEF